MPLFIDFFEWCDFVLNSLVIKLVSPVDLCQAHSWTNIFLATSGITNWIESTLATSIASFDGKANSEVVAS